MTFNTFSDYVTARREKRGWTQQEFADRCGLHVSAVSHIERGTRQPMFDTLAKLAHGFGITMSQLFEVPR